MTLRTYAGFACAFLLTASIAPAGLAQKTTATGKMTLATVADDDSTRRATTTKFTAAGGKDDGWATPGTLADDLPPDVDLQLMLEHIHADLKHRVVGYSTMIAEAGSIAKTSNWGYAKRGSDGSEPWTSSHRMQVASVSKTLTAIGALKLLDELGVSVETPIAAWLPAGWTLGSGWGSVTFRHLMTHTSGVNQAIQALSDDELDNIGNDWSGLQYVAGLDVAPGSASSYKNANYALLRILLPTLWTSQPAHPWFGVGIDEETHGPLHVLFMDAYVFDPAGVAQPGCWLTGHPAALLYNVADASVSGSASEIPNPNCGAHAGWHLSATDLLRVMVYLRHDPSFIPAGVLAEMDLKKLGWNQSSNSSSNGRAGKYWHGGTWWPGSGRGGHSCVMTFPAGVEASLLFNSNHTSGTSPCTILKEAYNDAAAGIPAPAPLNPYPNCDDPSDPANAGLVGCPCADIDIFQSDDVAGDGGEPDGKGSYLTNGLYGAGQFCAGSQTSCGATTFFGNAYPRCEACGVGTNIGCPCANHGDCQGVEADLSCWGLESDGWGDNGGGQCLPSANTPAGKEALEEMPWFCLDNCDAIDAYSNGMTACVFNQTSLDFPHGECVDLLSSCPDMQPGECEESGWSCDFSDSCEQECQEHSDCSAQGFPDWYLCDAQGDVTFMPAHCVPPECVNTSSSYCSLYR